MKKIKLLISTICISLFIISNATISASAYEGESPGTNTCSITWYSDINGDVPIEINYNGICTEYTYDSNMMRQSKTVDGVLYSEYNYENGRLVHEYKDGYDLVYHYKVENNIIMPEGFSYRNEEFKYGFEDNLIKFIYNSSDELIAEYEYDVYGRPINTLHYDMQMNSEELPEDMNSLVGWGYLYDAETGFFYISGLYYSPLMHEFLDKYTTLDFEETGIALLTTYEDDILSMYQSLINNASHGCNIESSNGGSGWCQNLSDVEILSRLIYGECTYSRTGYFDQRAAIAWVVRNRMDYTGTRFPKTARGVATQSGEFAVISGTEADTRNARKGINRSSAAWYEATRFACVLMVCPTSSAMSSHLSKPGGITNQKFFLSKNAWGNAYNASTGTVNNAAVTNIVLNVGGVGYDADRNIFFDYVNP